MIFLTLNLLSENFRHVISFELTVLKEEVFHVLSSYQQELVKKLQPTIGGEGSYKEHVKSANFQILTGPAITKFMNEPQMTNDKFLQIIVQIGYKSVESKQFCDDSKSHKRQAC